MAENKEPKMKIKARRRSSEAKPAKKAAMVATKADQLMDDDELDQALNIRVKERDPTEGPGRMGRPNRRLGQLFRDPSPAANAVKESIKESIKRPLSSLLRRPGSRAGGRKKEAETEPDVQQENGQVNIDDNELEELAGTAAGGQSPKVLEELAPKERRNASMDLGNEVREPSPDIPMLQDTVQPELGSTVAVAPSVAVNRVASYRELDNELMKHAAFSTLEDVDLSLLTRFLCPESEVRDESVPWTWDYLYTSICSELREEWLEEEAEQQQTEERKPKVPERTPNIRKISRDETAAAAML